VHPEASVALALASPPEFPSAPAETWINLGGRNVSQCELSSYTQTQIIYIKIKNNIIVK